MEMDVIIPLLGSSAAGAILGTILKGFWDRNSAKKAPKTESRAIAYQDFVVYVVSRSQVMPPPEKALTKLALNEIKARLILFGESKVVNAISRFLIKVTV